MSKHKTTYAFALAFAAAAVLAGCATDRESLLDGYPGDSDLSKTVQQNINQHAEFGAPDSIRAMTLDHVVYLNGLVDTGLEKRSAESVAKQVPGVTKVVNNIAVQN
jgi:osmotically-inducible protein OsmY